MCYNIMAVLVNKRLENATEVQKVLTKHGCLIKVRLGLHEAGDKCTNDGLIVLQLAGTKEEIETLNKELNEVEGVNAKTIELCN